MKDMIYKIRTAAKLTREEFAELFKVSRQSVQKWENGTATPELSKLVAISKYFGISLDTLILGNDGRMAEEMNLSKVIKPQYNSMHCWEFYPTNLETEYLQCVDEGLDIEKYKDVFFDVLKLPQGEIKKRFGDIIFDVVVNAPQREGYKYIEPSTLEEIKALRKSYYYKASKISDLESKVHGGWMGRICGCFLGKTVECIHTDELVPFLKETNNYPMHRYIYKSDLNDEILNKYKYPFATRCYADAADGMPVDDDTNYIVLAQKVIEDYGRDFTPCDVSRAWLQYQKKDAYCTAERVAFCNFIKGFEPPQSAVYQNPFREWIGAQIRGDYFGYINPGNPDKAAEMAWRDASISHVKNGIYGEMFASAMIAIAAVSGNTEDIILGGLAQIPHTSRLYEEIMTVVDGYNNGVSQKECFESIHKKYDEHVSHGWCHTISNAMIVAASLLYGNGDYGKSICMAVETGFDTDCNGATVGSVLGVMLGIDGIPQYWKEPVKDTLHTSIFTVGTVKISDRVKMTLNHIE